MRPAGVGRPGGVGGPGGGVRPGGQGGPGGRGGQGAPGGPPVQSNNKDKPSADKNDKSEEKGGKEKPPAAETTKNDAPIAWFATLSRGLAEAKRTGKPILFVSAAPHCAGVSGMW